MTNYQARIIAMSVMSSSIVISGHLLAGCIAYGVWGFIETIGDERR